MLIAIAISHPAKITIALMAGIIVFFFIDYYIAWLAKHRHRMRRELLREARHSHAKVLSGLRKMAEVFTDLPEHPLDLSDQGIQLLDSQARAADSFSKLCGRYPTMSRERKSRHLMRVLSKLQDQETRFETFQKGILQAVSDQARRGIVSPPVPGRCYRAVFTLLNHDLPEALWPPLEEVLAMGVTLRMQDVDGDWHPVPLKFSGGGKAVFSRKYLERAVALQMVVGFGTTRHEVFDYGVTHALPVKPMRGIK